MAWESHNRKYPLPADWSLRRIRVLRRDGYRCQERHSTGELCGELAHEVDHIVPRSQGGGHELENLRAICRWHHGRKSSAEGRAARRPRPTQKRDPEPHPGRLP